MDSRVKHYFISNDNLRLLYKMIIKHVFHLGRGQEEFIIGEISPSGVKISTYYKNKIDQFASQFAGAVAPKHQSMSEKQYLIACNNLFIQETASEIIREISQSLQRTDIVHTLEDSEDEEPINEIYDDSNADELVPPIAAAEESGSDLDTRLKRLTSKRHIDLKPSKAPKMKKEQLARRSISAKNNLNYQPPLKQVSPDTQGPPPDKIAQALNRHANHLLKSDSDSDTDSDSEPDSSDQEDTITRTNVPKPKQKIIYRNGKKISNHIKTHSSPPLSPPQIQQQILAPLQKPEDRIVYFNFDTRSLENDQQTFSYKIKFPFSGVKKVRLVGAEIPRSAYNITKRNNRIFFEEEQGKQIQIEIEPGYYQDFESLRRAIEEQMKKRGQSMFSVAEDPRSRKVTISASPSGGKNVQLFNLDWSKPHTLAPVLGFPLRKLTGQLAYKGDRTHRLSGENYVLLRIPEFGARFSDGTTFSKIPLDVPDGYVKYYYPENDSQSFDPQKDFEEITISFYSFTGECYDFRDQHHSLTFALTLAQ